MFMQALILLMSAER